MFWPFAMGARNEHQEEQNNIITRISLSSGVAIALAVAAWLPSSAAEKNEKEANDYTRSVACPFAQVLAAVKEAAQAQGFQVSNVHDIAASLRKDGIQREPYATVEVCNTKIAAQVLNAEPCPSKTTGFLPNKPFRATPV